MPIYNKSYFNSGLMQVNKYQRDKELLRSAVDYSTPNETNCILLIEDCLQLLKEIPDESVQLILVDPPYNLDLAAWDTYDNYIGWAAAWLDEAYRVLAPTGNIAIFGGTQFKAAKGGDLIEIIHYCHHHTKFELVNTIVWYYKNDMTARRYFANRHEEIIWMSKTNRYYFALDSVRLPLSEKAKKVQCGTNVS